MATFESHEGGQATLQVEFVEAFAVRCVLGSRAHPIWSAIFRLVVSMLTYVVDGGGGDDEAVVADVSHLGHRQDLVLSRGGRDGQGRTAARVLPELPGRNLLLSRGAG